MPFRSAAPLRFLAVLVLTAVLVACGGKGQIPPAPTTMNDTHLQRIVSQEALAAGVPPRLIMAIIQVESSGNPDAVNPSGTSEGLMQLTRGTANKYGAFDRFDPVANVAAGAHYMRDLLAHYRGDVKLALAAYNVGPAAVDAAKGVPPRGSAFVNRVLDIYLR